MDEKVKMRIIDFMLLFIGVFYLFIFSETFNDIHVLVPLIIGIIALLIFNFFAHKLLRKKIIFYIIEFIGFALFVYGYLGILTLILYFAITDLLYENLSKNL